ncbi:MAG: DUF521 domain-containing protein [Erysipelotrichaceae bacterium]|nr:DUF521 domain-containing protein [Erysipelotrichaceae bacterium]
MQLTKQQEDLLNGAKGETLAKVMKTLVMYGQAFDATRMVEVSSQYNHLVTSFGLGVMKPVYELMDTLLKEGVRSNQKFTVDPRPLDPNVPTSFLQDLIFKHFMYSKQDFYEKQLNELGLLEKDAFTCTCYMSEVGNTPKKGEVLSWSESSAVVYANSVLGARCNRNSGIIDIMGSIVGYVPYFGLLTDEGRKADWIVKIETSKKPEAQLLGSAIGMKVMEDVPYVVGLDKWLGKELNEEACTYLKDFGAATASNGAVGLYHIENLTPEAVEAGRSLLKENVKEYVIDDAELQRVYNSYPVVWKNADAKPKLCFMGCPHMSLQQLKDWTEKIETQLDKYSHDKVLIPTVFTAAPAVIAKFRETDYYPRLQKTGVILSYICPLMFMNNPLCAKMPVITSSNKLRTYTTSRYYTDEEILMQLCR